ncbi:MAG: prepilin-type N-terminal cleavage/methylation domain-containing protein [Firmicutes bacterium]|nr:prepilin-type N-terminal cleavage/methylation domain-containing protein [Bacillota bacterium]
MKGLQQKRGRRGFTLVEITVALGIFAIVMLGLAAVAGISAQGGYASKQRLRATYLASQMLETLCSPSMVTQNDLRLFVNGDNTANPATYISDPTAAIIDAWAQNLTAQLGPGASGTIAVAQNALGNDLITVTVTWLLRGRNQSLTMVAVR